jgi:hypothetical protein
MRRLLICAIFILTLFLSACDLFNSPTNASEKCAGLKRQMTFNKNTNSYDRNLLDSQNAGLKKEYQALNCHQ